MTVKHTEGHIDLYRATIRAKPNFPPWYKFMCQMRALSYTESMWTRMKGVWGLNNAQ